MAVLRRSIPSITSRLLEKYDGKDPHSVFKVEPTQFNNVGKVMASPWKFRQHGQCGQWVSELFPHVAKCVDEMAFRSLDDLEVPGAHERQLFPAHRQRHAGPAEHGRLGQLWPGQRIARICPASSCSMAA